MTTTADDSDEESETTEHTDDSDEMSKEEIEAKVEEHIQRRKAAYVKMGTVDSGPEE